MNKRGTVCLTKHDEFHIARTILRITEFQKLLLTNNVLSDLLFNYIQ